MFDVRDMQFPLLSIVRGNGFVAHPSYETLTTCSPRDLGAGYFADMLLIESSGQCVRIGSAHEIQGSGTPWWMFPKKIRVELVVADEPSVMTLYDVKESLLRNLQPQSGDGQASGEIAAEQTLELLAIKRAKSIEQLIAELWALQPA